MFSAIEDAFLNQHRWAVLTHLDKTGAPASSVVAYARDGDRFVVSTPGGTAKRHRIAGDGRVNLCVISNQEPFNFVAIQGDAEVSREDLKRRTQLVFAALKGTSWTEPENLERWLETQRRVVLMIQPISYHAVQR